MRLAELSREELAVLALMASVAGESRVFSRRQDMRRLSKLAFLAAYGDKGNDGSIRLRDKPRLRLRFHVYLYGVASRDTYDVIRGLEERGLIERIDVDVYRINVSAEEVLEAVKRYGDLYDGVMPALSYKDMTGRRARGLCEWNTWARRPRAQGNSVWHRCAEAPGGPEGGKGDGGKGANS